MAYYLVRARPIGSLEALRARVESGEIRGMRPFGGAMDHALRHARQDSEWLVWEEEDYCRPPLAMERAAVFDDYFTDLRVEKVDAGEGWKRIEALPPLWEGLAS